MSNLDNNLYYIEEHYLKIYYLISIIFKLLSNHFYLVINNSMIYSLAFSYLINKLFNQINK